MIDNENLNHLIWEFAAKENHVPIMTATTESQFIASNVPMDALVFVDKNLDDDISGVDVAERLSKLGHENVYLATGEILESSDHPDFLKGIVGKDFPSDLIQERLG